MRIHFAVSAIVMALGLAACAGPHASGTYQTSASYSRLYAGSLSAVSKIGYTVTSSNKADGLIVAQQGVLGGEGSTAGFNAHISEDANHRILEVSLVGPPGTMVFGDFNENLNEYIAHVRATVPDLTAAQTRSGG